jgi:hypothetical protein
MLPNAKTRSDSGLSTKTTRHEKTISLNESLQITNNNTGHNNFDNYENIEEIITRIKRDVIVTGTITGTPGQESAIFQIENMPDITLQINTQLMDGFIITEITHDQVVLKNQAGNESFSMPVEAGNLSKPMAPDSYEPGSLKPDEFEPRPLEPDSFEPEPMVPGSYEPGTLQPDEFEPRPLEPDSFEPEPMAPGSYEPGPLGPDEFEPRPLEPNSFGYE